MEAREVPPFLRKLWDMVHEPCYDELIAWSGEDCIRVKEIGKFAQVVLPKYFKHSNYSSFTRQLFKYDFHKTAQDPLDGEFKHPNFVKGRPELLVFIQRKGSNNSRMIVDMRVGDNIAYCPDMDFDAIFGDKTEAFDFECGDDVDTSLERGLLLEDDSRLSALEKRQADLISENEEIKNLIQETTKQNDQIMSIMNTVLGYTMDIATEPNSDAGIPGEVCDASDELSELLLKSCNIK